MPNDILKRLRFWSDDIGALIPSAQVATVKEAADEIERLRSVVDAARGVLPSGTRGPTWTVEERMLDDAIRALDGEPCQTCGGCGYLMTDDPRKDEDCLTCHGSGKSWKYKPGTTNEHEPRESCGGTGRKP